MISSSFGVVSGFIRSSGTGAQFKIESNIVPAVSPQWMKCVNYQGHAEGQAGPLRVGSDGPDSTDTPGPQHEADEQSRDWKPPDSYAR